MPGGEGCMLPDPMMFIPFWSGIHNCIGQHVVWIEVKVILMRVVAKYNVKVKPDYELKMAMKSLWCGESINDGFGKSESRECINHSFLCNI